MLFFTNWIDDDQKIVFKGKTGKNLKNQLGLGLLWIVAIFITLNILVIVYAGILQARALCLRKKTIVLRKKLEELKAKKAVKDQVLSEQFKQLKSSYEQF